MVMAHIAKIICDLWQVMKDDKRETSVGNQWIVDRSLIPQYREYILENEVSKGSGYGNPALSTKDEIDFIGHIFRGTTIVLQ